MLKVDETNGGLDEGLKLGNDGSEMVSKDIFPFPPPQGARLPVCMGVYNCCGFRPGVGC